MRNIFFSLVILTFHSCATKQKGTVKLKSQEFTYSYKDTTGTFLLKKEVLLKGRKIVTRSQLFDPQNPVRPLEKTTSISNVGTIKQGAKRLKIARPEVSQHFIWLEGKKRFSQLRLDTTKKKIESVIDSEDLQGGKVSHLDIPKGVKFCFFSQLIECLKAVGFFHRPKSKQQYDFYLIWDNYPFHKEQFEQVSDGAFEYATIRFENKKDTSYHYLLEIGRNILIFHLDQESNVDKMFWIAQGIEVNRTRG